MNAMSKTTAGKKFVRLAVPLGPMANAPQPETPAQPTQADILNRFEQLNRAVAEFRQANDERLAQVERRGSSDVVTNEKVDRINSEVTNLNNTVNALTEEVRNSLARSGASAGREGMSAQDRTYSQAFASWVRGLSNDAELNAAAAAYRNTLQSGSDPDGGFLLPPATVGAMTRVLQTVSAMRNLAQVITIAGNRYTKTHNLAGAAGGWVNETGSRTTTGTPTLSQLEFPVFEVYANPAATQTTLDDAGMDVEAWLGGEVAIVFAEKEATAFISGDGVSAPRGIKSYTIVANGSYAWGKVGYTATGVAANIYDGSNNGGDALISLQHSLKQGYRPGSQWLMNDATQAAVRKLKDTTGQYLWMPGLQPGAPGTLLGAPVAIDDNMDDIGANKYPIAWANWPRAYVIVDRQGIRTLRDPYTNKPYVQFYTTKRVGGGIQDFAAIKLLKCATS